MISHLAAFGTADRNEAMRWRRHQARRLGVSVETITAALRERCWTLWEVEAMSPADAHMLSVGAHVAKPGTAAGGELLDREW